MLQRSVGCFRGPSDTSVRFLEDSRILRFFATAPLWENLIFGIFCQSVFCWSKCIYLMSLGQLDAFEVRRILLHDFWKIQEF